MGLQGLAWPALNAAIDAGLAPTFQRLVEGGASAQLDVKGLSGAPFWASVATGRDPIRHRLFGSAQSRPDGGGVEPVGARSWAEPALWQVLHGAGLRTATACWPATAPAAAWPGQVIDDRYPYADVLSPDDWPLAPDCIQPADSRETLRDIRVHPSDLDEPTFRMFTDTPTAVAAVAIAETANVQAAAMSLAAPGDWDALTVCYPLYRLLPTPGALTFVDGAVGKLLEVGGETATVLVVSDLGVFIGAGAGFEPDALIHGLSLLDIKPLALAAFGLKRTGSARPAAWPERQPAWDSLREADAEALSPAPTGPETDTVRFQDLAGEAAALMGLGDFAKASALLEQWLQAAPDQPDALLLLGQCRFFLGDWAACDGIGEALERLKPEQPWGPMLIGAALAAQGRAAEGKPHLDRAAERAAGNPEAQVRLGAIHLRLNDFARAETHYRHAMTLAPDLPDAHAGLAMARLAQNDVATAEAHLRRSLTLRHAAPPLHQLLGELLMATGRPDEAAGWLQSAEALRARSAAR